jgi:hypothetical protein
VASSSPRVFISYSHESEQHREAVLTFAGRLRGQGIDACIDRYVHTPAQGWDRWVEEQIRLAQFVLCICTKRYRLAFEGRYERGGLGVNNEGLLIARELCEAGRGSEKFIPVLLAHDRAEPGGRPEQFELYERRDHVPHVLKEFHCYRLPEDDEALHRRLTGQPDVFTPALGESRTPARRAARSEAQPALPTRSAGNPDSAAPLRRITADDLAVEPGDTPGLYITRLVNPPSRENADALTSIWLTAVGDAQYRVDSIRLEAHPPDFGGVSARVTLPVDAQYSCYYGEDSDRVHPLKPAVSVGPRTRRSVILTVRFIPEDDVRAYGSLHAWLNYHLDDGTRGCIEIATPPRWGASLAALVGRDIEVSSARRRDAAATTPVITSGGLIRGLDEAAPAALRYQPLPLTSLQWIIGYDPAQPQARIPAPARCVDALRRRCEQVLAARLPLIEALPVGEQAFADFVLQHADDERTWELCGSIGDRSVDRLFDRLPRQRRQPSLRRSMLAGWHLRCRDRRLLQLIERMPPLTPDFEDYLVPLLLFPVPGWERAWAARQASEVPLHRWRLALAAVQFEPVLERDDWLAVMNVGEELFGVPVFLRGSMNEWGLSLPFTRRSAISAEAEVTLTPGRHLFKIADEHWQRRLNMGSGSDGVLLSLDQPLRLSVGEFSGNIAIDVPQPALYRVSLSVVHWDDWQVRVTAVG